MMITAEQVRNDVSSLPANYKTKDVDALINKYVKAGYDLSPLKAIVLSEQQLHRIYFHGSLKQIRDVNDIMKFIHDNLLFSDWWHTDQLINFVSELDFTAAYEYSRKYVYDKDPFIRRWGYVMFISKLCRNKDNLDDIISLLHNDESYYVQMAEAWLIAELARKYVIHLEYPMNINRLARSCVSILRK